MEADVDRILAKYGGDHDVLMGSGSLGYYTPYFQPDLVFKGMPIGLQTDAINDFVFSGVSPPLPSAIIKACNKSVVWLIPKGQAPFTLVNWYSKAAGVFYADPDKIFPDAFRAEFASKFKLTDQTEFYDIYAAQGP